MRTEIIEILANSGVKISDSKKEALAKELMQLLTTKSSGQHAPYTENGITYVWCSRHCEYHPSDVMVPNKSKDCGYANYCKPAQRKWEWMHKHSQLLGSVSARLHQDDNHDDASTIFFHADTMKKEKNNQPGQYQSITIDMSADEVVEACKAEWYPERIRQLIPADLLKQLGLVDKVK